MSEAVDGGDGDGSVHDNHVFPHAHPPTASQYVLAGIALAEVSVILAQRFSPVYATRVLTILGSPAIELTSSSVIGTLFGCAGGLMRMWCHLALGASSHGRCPGGDHKLITHGLYSFVRHSSYMRLVLMTCGNIIYLASKGSNFVEAGL